MARPRRNAAPDTLDRSLTHRLHTLSKLTDRVSQQAYADDAGMGLSEGRCLAAVGAFGPLSVNDLAQHANLDKGQASRAAQALVAQGLVLKTASDSDARAVVLRLSASGQRRWQQVMAVVARRNAEILACLDPAEQAQFSALLDRLLAQARSAVLPRSR